MTTLKACLNFAILIGALMQTSCKHDNFEEFVGEGICPGQNFAITTGFQVSSNNIDLSLDALEMTAVFTEAAKWNITLTGLTSGATRSYSGKSATVNVSWYGQPGSMTFFRNEDVKVEFVIPCREALTVIDTVTINPNNFATFGSLVSDFDGNGYVSNPVAIGYSATGWSSYGHNPPSGTTFTSYGAVNSPLTSPAGPEYMHLFAQPVAGNWWGGELQANISLSSLSTSDPDSIYLNTFVYGDNRTSLAITLLTGSSGTYKKVIDIGNWTGWKYISIKLSDFQGNGTIDPLNVIAISYGIGPSKAAGDLVQLNFDMVLFTTGEPFYQEQ